MKSIVVIPARMQSSRLPGKPLADIHGEPMIRHVLRRAMEADVGPVIVAAGDHQIADALQSGGATVILTDPSLASGSDRSHAALDRYDPDHAFDVVINLQGDMPTITPAAVQAAIALLDRPSIDIATLATPFHARAEVNHPQVVKVAMEPLDGQARIGRAVYFSRSPIPYGADELFHHIGLYVYRRQALERFVASPPSALERVERLEQLRALALGLTVGVAIVDAVPLGVDTPEDLEEARRLLAPGIRAH